MVSFSLEILDQVKNIPKKPGVYQFYSESGSLLYIGKAKILKNRVSSYFNRDNNKPGRTRLMVKKIRSIKFIITETELDALLLENNLIKKNQPRYNVMLKDDKTYPWLCIKKEAFPRVFSTRKKINDGSEYYGPYASAFMLNTLLELIRKNYLLRSCSYVLSDENIQKKKFKVCLEHHIGNCLGPCEGLEKKASYDQKIEEIRSLINGDIKQVKRQVSKDMKSASDNLDYELAHELKGKLLALDRFQAKSSVVSSSTNKADVFSFIDDQGLSYVNYLSINQGAVVQSFTLSLKHKIEESREDLLEMAIIELREKYQSESNLIILPFKINVRLPNVKMLVPQRGEKKKLLELSHKNAKYFMLDQRRQIAQVDPERHSKRILGTIQKDLRLNDLPVHIECFDNSNIQGSNPVAACVVFKNAKPMKSEYRHFNIKTVTGPDDFASMEEAVYRRYSRLLNEKKDLPQLIVIDGGKGQLSAALKSLDRLKLRGVIAIIGIAKRLEEIFFPGDQYPLFLDKSSETLKVIQHLRNEAHRFGINHHRNRRSKSGLVSELDGIAGIGPKSKEKLFLSFKTIGLIKSATLKELKAVLNESQAKSVYNHFKKNPA